MKNVLRADFFDLRKSKMVWILPIGAVALGILLPMMYYGIFSLFRYLASLDAAKNNSTMVTMNRVLGMLNARTVFFGSLPISEGFGLMLTAMLGFRAARPFATGVYRNKIVAGISRPAIYLSQFLLCLLLAAVSAALYTLATALTSRLTFGALNLSGKEILTVAILSFGIYLVYTAIPVFLAFFTQSTPLALIVSMLLPILMQTVISLLTPVLLNKPDVVMYVLAAFPTFQGAYMSNAGGDTTVMLIAIGADVLWAALLTLFGVLRFTKADMK